MNAPSPFAIDLDYAGCVRTRSAAATCQDCVAACPTGAVTVSAPPRTPTASITIDRSACIGCGACHAACPTGAPTTPVDLGALVEKAGPEIRCGEGLPCVAALSPEDLVVIALRVGAVTLFALPSCAAAAGHPRAGGNAEQANSLLGALGSAATVRAITPRPAPVDKAAAPLTDRRGFLRMFLPRTEAPRTPASAPLRARASGRVDLDRLRLDVARLRERPLPERRARLLAAIADHARARPPAARAVPIASGEVGFASSKWVNPDTCTACRQCVIACPTGALTTPPDCSELRLDESRCVACATCHDVCEPGAMRPARYFDTPRLVETGPRLLLSFGLRTCAGCRLPFRARGDETRCPRCAAAER